jgi:hypothetical protein
MPSQPWIRGTSIEESQVILPMDLQSHLQQTIQTHNAVSVAANNFSQSTWIDCDGFDKVAITMINDASTVNAVDVQWSNDATNIHGVESIIGNASSQYRYGITDTKARYARVKVYNLATDIAHTQSCWAYLKA